MKAINRRQFLTSLTAAAASTALPQFTFAKTSQAKSPRQMPNILWISSEDINCELGCYGDDYANTPIIDAFAGKSIRYTNCFAHAGVCAPARSGIITGVYPTTIGSNNMRCHAIPQPDIKMFTEYLRAAGWYCTNNSKTD